jgi:hypothetical protein
VSIRGPEGSALPNDLVVFRLAPATSDGQMAPEHFVLSTEDKKAVVPRLSVWVDGMTTLAQAHTLTQHRNGIAGYLPVARIHEMRPSPDDPAVRNLRVEWEEAEDAASPGAHGHAGIAGLDQDGRDAKGQGLNQYRKRLRAQLARLANATGVVALLGPPAPAAE